MAIDPDLVPALLAALEGLGEHELAHPVDAIIPRVDGEVVALAVGEELLVFLCLRDEGEGKGLLGGECRLVLAEEGALEGGAELGRGGEARAGDGELVDVDHLERLALVLVDRETGAFERAVVILPLVTEEACGFALAHPAGVLHVFELERGDERLGAVLAHGSGADGGCLGERSDAGCEGVLAVVVAAHGAVGCAWAGDWVGERWEWDWFCTVAHLSWHGLGDVSGDWVDGMLRDGNVRG